MTEPDWERLDAAWQPARAAGVLGNASIEELRTHAAGFVPAACGVLDQAIDVGTGAGVPGIVLALLHPSSTWTLVDASERRCSLVRRVVHDMGLGERVTVRHGRAEELGHDPRFRSTHDLVVARLLGPVRDTIELAAPLVRVGQGLAVVSVDHTTAAALVTASVPHIDLGVREMMSGMFVDLRVPSAVPPEWPRRPSTRRRTPLF